VTALGSRRAVVDTDRPRFRVGVRTVFFALLLVVLGAYLQQAMGMEWRTAAGRIGPGFFPRVIGVLGVVLTVVALVRSVRADRAGASTDEPAAGEEEEGEADLGRHPRTTALVVLGCAGLVAVYVALGAAVASALFLFGCLWLLGRPHPALNAAISVGFAVGLYLLFETLLGAGLPEGVLRWLG
jgi:putative tricarboxylic transport membrane protein